LFAVAVLALLNLWCWSEPLLLVLVVVPGVVLLALVGWLVDTFSLAGAVGVLIALAVVVAISTAEIRKRFFRNPPSQ
jgi:F0F1-type ATP synthase assembly protein I